MVFDTFSSQAMGSQTSLSKFPGIFALFDFRGICLLASILRLVSPKNLPSRVKLFPSSMAKWLLTMPQKDFLELLTQKRDYSRWIDRLSKLMKPTNEYVEERTVQSIAQDIINNGGMDEILKILPRDFVATEMQRFSNILTKSYRKGVGFNGNSYEFSKENIQLIQNQGRRFYTVLWEKFHALYLESFTSLAEIRK